MATRMFIGEMPLSWPHVESWFKQMDFYIQANKQADLDKAVLLSMCGSDAFRLVETLLSPTDIASDSVTYETIQQAVLCHLRPKRILHYERHLLHSMIQQEGEGAALFLQRLKDQATRCDFGAMKDELLLSQFIFGLRSQVVRAKLLADATLNLATAVQETLLQETVDTAAPPETVVSALRQGHAVKETKDKNKLASGYRSKNSGSKQQGPCFSCGKENHLRQNCKFRDAKCFKCNRRGHIAAACKSRTSASIAQTSCKPRVQHMISDVVLSVTSDISSESRLWTEWCTVGKVNVSFLIDTGSEVTLLPEKLATATGLSQVSSSVSVRAYGGQTIPILGCIEDAVIKIGGKQCSGTILVSDNAKRAILGMDYLRSLGVIDCLSTNINTSVCSPIQCNESRFSASFRLKKDVCMDGMCYAARSLPFSMKTLVEVEIRRLLAADIIFPVKDPVISAPIVPVVKQVGAERPIRLCGDYSRTLNQIIDADSYTIPTLEQILHRLAGASRYSVLDLKDAYLQVILSKESQLLTCVSTHLGHFAYRRLQFGISAAPLIFQEIMDTVLRDISGVAAYQDDIIISGIDVAEHDRRLCAVKARLQQYGFEINESKSQINKTAVSFLGFLLSEGKLLPHPDRLEAFSKLRVPKDKLQLRSVLGTLRHYGQFCRNFSIVARPLYDLLRNNVRWHWTDKHETVMRTLIKVISDGQITCYQMNKPLFVTADASKDGIGYVLSHDQHQREVVWLGSRVLSQAEARYSNIEREALAVVEAVKYFHKFLCGRRFTIISDHRPLQFIFNAKSASERISARLQRWVITLGAYDYQLVYKKGEQMFAADVLSRLPRPESLSITPVVNLLDINSLSEFSSGSSLLRRIAVYSDKTMKLLKRYIINGWPTYLPKPMYQWSKERSEYSIQDGIVYRGLRVVVPSFFRREILTLLHENHPGILKMIRLARQYFWWPSIDADVNRHVQRCTICQMNARKRIKANLASWPEAKDFWERVHVDVAYFLHHKFLVLVDAATKWVDVHLLTSNSSSAAVSALRRSFKYVGLPCILVSDNGTNFVSAEFEGFLRDNFVEHICSPPGHHQSNGQAERVIQELKFFLRKSGSTVKDIERAVIQFCLHQNTTPAANGSVATDFVFNRSLRTKLSIKCTELNLPGQVTPAYVRREGQSQSLPTIVRKYGSNTSVDDSGRIVHDSDIVQRSEEVEAEATEPTETGVSEPEITEEVPLRRSQRVRRKPARFGFPS